MLRKFICIIMLTVLLSGCAYTLHKREKNKADPLDQGSTTELLLRGPKAAIQHKF